MNKPTKPTDLVPRSFGGVKNNFSPSLQSSGYEDGVPTIYGGDNLNYQLDATGKELDYCEKICDFINGIPIGKTIAVDANNKLVYTDYQYDDKVSKSGDTMTGDLTLQGNYESDNYPIKIQDTNLVKGTAPAENHYKSVRYLDSNGDDLGGLQHRYLTDGSIALSLTVPSLTQANTYNGLYAIANADGTIITQAPTPPSGDNSTKIATTAFVNTDFLPKSGGTMTGALHIAVNTQYAADIIIDSKTIDINSTTSVASNDGIHFYDKNGNLGCYLIWQQQANSNGNYMAIGYNSTVNPNFLGFNLPKATSKATTTSSASIYKPAVVVQNYVNGTSWYRVWSDGWIEQGGSWYGDGTKSLLKNFSNTNYSITYGLTSPGNSTNTVYISDKAANQFTIAQFNGNGGAGNWYACGY